MDVKACALHKIINNTLVFWLSEWTEALEVVTALSLLSLGLMNFSSLFPLLRVVQPQPPPELPAIAATILLIEEK